MATTKPHNSPYWGEAAPRRYAWSIQVSLGYRSIQKTLSWSKTSQPLSIVKKYIHKLPKQAGRSHFVCYLCGFAGGEPPSHTFAYLSRLLKETASGELAKAPLKWAVQKQTTVCDVFDRLTAYQTGFAVCEVFGLPVLRSNTHTPNSQL